MEVETKVVAMMRRGMERRGGGEGEFTRGGRSDLCGELGCRESGRFGGGRGANGGDGVRA